MVNKPADHGSSPAHAGDGHKFSGRSRIAWIVFAAIASFFLWTEHRAHLLGVLPFLLLLACPLMHFFMHGRHSDTDKGDDK